MAPSFVIDNTAQVCREHQLANSVVSRWQREYQTYGDKAFSTQARPEPTAEERIAELERCCGQLAVENMLLKKALGKLPVHGDAR